MRLDGHVLCFLCLIVALVVGLREVPESLRLLDDTSNDGESAISYANTVSGARFASRSRQHPPCELISRNSRTLISVDQFARTSLASLVVPAGSGLLHHLAVQRE